MNLQDYFSEHAGTGVLATADKEGVVNTAVYARPHVFDDMTLGFITRDRLTRRNLLENDHAGYLFHEDGGGHRGIRLRLKLIEESADHALLSQVPRSHGKCPECKEDEPRFLIRFAPEKCLALVGGNEIPLVG